MPAEASFDNDETSQDTAGRPSARTASAVSISSCVTCTRASATKCTGVPHVCMYIYVIICVAGRPADRLPCSVSVLLSVTVTNVIDFSSTHTRDRPYHVRQLLSVSRETC